MHFKLITIFSLFCLFNYSVCLDYDGWLNIRLEHSIGCEKEKFCSRGNISLKSLRAGTAVIEQIDFNKQHIEELKSLAEIDDFYTIRSIVTSADNSKGLDFFSSMKAKSFLANGLSDDINAWVLPNGAVISVSFKVTNSSQSFSKTNPNHKITSKFHLRYVDQAPVPDTASYIQKLERERELREKGDMKDNRSFFAKYWMYIVPIAIFVLISGAPGLDANANQPAR